MSKYILVTGGCGYIGGMTAITLAEQGFSVVVLDKKIKPLGFTENLEYIQADLRDINSLELLDAYEFDCVLHFAAFIEVGISVQDPISFYQNNVAGTINLLNYMEKRGVKNIVFSSTAASYGNPEGELGKKPLVEDLMPSPINPYGSSKVIVEKLMLELQSLDRLNPVIFRYFNASGADLFARHGEEHEPETHLIPIIFEAAMGNRESIKIYGTDYPTLDGTCIRDYIHVQDLADAHVIAAKRIMSGEKFPEPIFNLGNGFGYSVKEVINTVKKVTDLSFVVEQAPRRAGDPAFLVADNNKAKKLLQFSPQHSDLENIIKTHYQFLLKKDEKSAIDLEPNLEDDYEID
ncbi:MAG: UDP-glucose 4-epimerase GalE [Patescibacteria group bacterium]